MFYRHYPQILACLSNVVAKEQHAGTLDNICGALARLISTNSSLVPMKEVSRNRSYRVATQAGISGKGWEFEITGKTSVQ